MRTFHDDLHVIDQTIDDVQGLSNGHLGLLEGESIEPLEDRFNVFFSE
jgi:hypothetical protein